MDEVRLSKKAAKLTKMAEEEFGKSRTFTQAERRLFAAVITDSVAICGPNDDDMDQRNNPEYVHEWPDQRSIDAELIRWLCADHRARDLVDPRGIQVYGAKFIGSLNLRDLVVMFPIALEHCAIPKNAILYSLEVPALSLEGSRVSALNANGIRVKNDVILRNGFRADGEVELMDAQIGGQLDCSNAKFINPSGIALNGDGLCVAGSLYLRKVPYSASSLDQDFRVEGEVKLLRAQIGENLECTNGEFLNPPQVSLPESGIAIFADGISVKVNVFLRSKFKGEVRLLDSRIGADLECQNGQFINPEVTKSNKEILDNSGDALSLHRSVITGDVFLTERFYAHGNVNLRGARIEGALDCSNGNFNDADLWLEHVTTKVFGDSRKGWPRNGHLHLNGFVYQSANPLLAEEKLDWIGVQPQGAFFPQPYLQLAKVLGDGGDEDGKIKVLVTMKDREWSAKRRGLIGSLFRWPLKATIGYGYRPLLAFWEVMGLSALGWIVYRRSYLAGGVVPSDKDAYQEFKSTSQPPDYHKRFSPLIYSLENSLPLVTLGQAEKWQPDPSRAARPESTAVKPTLGSPRPWPGWMRWLQRALVFVGLHTPADAPRTRASRWGTSPRFLRWFLWAQILLGWLLATLFLAGISGIIKKE